MKKNMIFLTSKLFTLTHIGTDNCATALPNETCNCHSIECECLECPCCDDEKFSNNSSFR